MVENENYKSYTANNGTELRFPKESVIQMTAEQRGGKVHTDYVLVFKLSRFGRNAEAGCRFATTS